MRVLFLSGSGEPPYSANMSLYAALKHEGHDVLWCGPGYFERDCSDIPIEDRPHPEYYTYAEVLALCPWTPDLMLVVEPHFFLTGEKPKGITSAIYLLDPHRGASLHLGALQHGDYDIVFLAQWYFAPLFRKNRLIYLPQAFDERRFPQDEPDFEPECDISFIGQTGIAGMEYPYEDIIGRYATAPPNNLPTDHTRFAFHGSHGFDYAERAEMLIRLCKDFSVRMYTDLYTSGFQAAIRTGRVGFHRSLLYDLTLRPFEVMAAGRPVVMDTIPDLGTAFRGIPNTYQSLFYEYRSYFKPFFENFKLEYEQARDIVRGILDHPDTVAVNVKAAKYFAFKNHTWGARARRIAETLRA